MNIQQKEGGQQHLDPLDQFDELITHFRPIEKLFQLMGAVSFDSVDDDSLIKSCSEIGMNLSAQFRNALERVLKRS